MKVDIEQMPSTSRIWIYQASQNLSETQIHELEKKIAFFIEQWDTHGHPLKASWKLNYNRFLILAVDESFNPPSGCSIDKSVRFLQELESSLKINFLERSSVALENGNDEIFTVELKDIKKNVEEGKINSNSFVFNNLIDKLGDIEKNWKVPASQSWLSRYFTK
jgi:hypothetical protein